MTWKSKVTLATIDLQYTPKETKIEKDTCIPLFTAALFTIAMEAT